MVRDARTAQVEANLAAVRERIAAACASAGRAATEVTLVVVTKTYPASDVLRLASLGVTDVGENRDQEAAPKAAQVAAAGVAVRWHFVGRLQRNKCRSVARYAGIVESVDSLRLVEALDRAVVDTDPSVPEGASRDRQPGLDVLVQVSLDGDPTRGGAVAGGTDPQTSLERVLAAVAGAEGLRLRGLMAVAPMEWDPERAFDALAKIRAEVVREHPEATMLSAGMSGDFQQAIRHGATHVRVGSAVLGERPPLR